MCVGGGGGIRFATAGVGLVAIWIVAMDIIGLFTSMSLYPFYIHPSNRAVNEDAFFLPSVCIVTALIMHCHVDLVLDRTIGSIRHLNRIEPHRRIVVALTRAGGRNSCIVEDITRQTYRQL